MMSGGLARRLFVLVVPILPKVIDHVVKLMSRKYSFTLVAVDGVPGSDFGHGQEVVPEIALLIAVGLTQMAIELRGRRIWRGFRTLCPSRWFGLGFGRGVGVCLYDTS